MSYFNKNKGYADYSERMRMFLGYSVREYRQIFDFRKEDENSGRGRFFNNVYNNGISSVESACNQKSNLDKQSIHISQRLMFAISYERKQSMQRLRGALQVSHVTLSNWIHGKSDPNNSQIMVIADALGVPSAWLKTGNTDFLPADSVIGQLVGPALKESKQEFLDLTRRLLRKEFKGVLRETDVLIIKKRIEDYICEDIDARTLARKCGGRWFFINKQNLIEDEYVFAPYATDMQFGERLDLRPWPNEVEEIIKELLIKTGSISKAYPKIEDTCTAKNLPYPQRVTLYKRMKRLKHNIANIGVDIDWWVGTKYPVESRMTFAK